jgi:5-hydroxyisourate hydrolase-like protein (transthyretin family)
MSVSAIDAAGNRGIATRTVHVDNTPPEPVLPEAAGGSAWRRTNSFAISWRNAANSAAPIVRAHWKLCRVDEVCPWRGHRDAENVQGLTDFRLPGPGEFRLYVWLEDAAGNQREAHAPLSVPLRFDPEPPNLSFAPPDPADPLRVAVNAIDHHSGLASGEIEMRAVGSSTWHGLRTERDGAQLVGYVDDERFRTGAYEFRARGADHAGNEASTNQRADGSAARLRLPARIDTRLAVGVPRQARARKGAKRRTVRLDSNVRAAYGRALRLGGRLTNADGQPVDAATIEALQANEDGELLPIGLATTGTDGRFRYVVRASRNRSVLFRYAGSRRIGAATAPFRLRVPASSSIEVDRAKARNGQAVMFDGRVISRPIPAHGKLIEVQAHFRGRWRTFSTVRTDRSGRWRFPYRFGATLGRVVYRFRVRLPAEGGYPFVSGRSRTAKVVVFGP